MQTLSNWNTIKKLISPIFLSATLKWNSLELHLLVLLCAENCWWTFQVSTLKRETIEKRLPNAPVQLIKNSWLESTWCRVGDIFNAYKASAWLGPNRQPSYASKSVIGCVWKFNTFLRRIIIQLVWFISKIIAEICEFMIKVMKSNHRRGWTEGSSIPLYCINTTADLGLLGIYVRCLYRQNHIPNAIVSTYIHGIRFDYITRKQGSV